MHSPAGRRRPAPRAQPQDPACLPALPTAAYYSGQAYTAQASWLVIDLGKDIAMSDISTVAMDITALANNGYEKDQACLLVQWVSDTGAVLQTNRNNRVRANTDPGRPAGSVCGPQLLRAQPAWRAATGQAAASSKRHQPLPFAPAGPAVRLLLLPRAAGRCAATPTWVPCALQLQRAARVAGCSCRC
jgi:hypothetical protein